MNKLLISFLFCICIVSCNDDEPQKEEKELTYSEKIDIEDSIFKSEVKSFIYENKAATGWDTLKYTYQLQDFFEDKIKVIGFNGIVKDIKKVDRGYVVSVWVYKLLSNYDGVANLFLNPTQFKNFESILLTDTKKYIMAKINTINTYNPVLKAENENETESYPILSFDDILLKLEGDFITCISKKEIR
jgi:hypothetical protein